MIAWIAAVALAGTAEELTDALTEEMARATAELSLPEAPEIYHLRYQLATLEQTDVVASLGGLVRSHHGPANGLGVEMRVGSAAFDNTGFGGWQNGFLRMPLPDELTTTALQLGAWRATDRAYKEAVEQYARKDAQYTPPTDHPGDYQLLEDGADTTPTPPATPQAPADATELDLEAVAVTLSAVLAEGPPLVRGEVVVGAEHGELLTVDTAGAVVRRPIGETTIRALAQLRTADGMFLTDHRLWSVSATHHLPSVDEMTHQVTDLRDELQALADAPALVDEYVGPVIFEQDAAVDLFRYLLVNQIEGTPAEIPFDSWFGDMGAAKDPVRLGRRVLPPGWSVSDDPQARPDLASSFAFDIEGTPTATVQLVEDGIVRDVLMSRVPRKGVDGTNGHARGWLGERAEGRVAQLEIVPPKQLSARAIHRRALRLAQAYGRDWYVVVRRLQDPAVRTRGQSYNLFGDNDDASLPPPVAVIRVNADGSEQVLRGAGFSGVERWLLRDIVAAGPSRHAVWLAPTTSYGAGITTGLSTFTQAPEVLVGEVELVPMPGDPREATVLSPPP